MSAEYITLVNNSFSYLRMTESWKIKESILLSIAWDVDEPLIPFSIFTFNQTVSSLTTKKEIFDCEYKFTYRLSP